LTDDGGRDGLRDGLREDGLKDCQEDGLRTGLKEGVPDETALPAVSGPGHGLLVMRERLELLGGTLHIGPEGTGWALRALLPAAAAADADVRDGQAPAEDEQAPVEDERASLEGAVP
jgi:hypothetical protein